MHFINFLLVFQAYHIHLTTYLGDKNVFNHPKKWLKGNNQKLKTFYIYNIWSQDGGVFNVPKVAGLAKAMHA